MDIYVTIALGSFIFICLLIGIKYIINAEMKENRKDNLQANSKSEENSDLEELKKYVRLNQEKAGEKYRDLIREKENVRKELDRYEETQIPDKTNYEAETQSPKRTISIDCYSQYNKILYLTPVGSVIGCSIENLKIGRSENFFVDDEFQAKEFLEMIFKTWAEQEDNLLYYPHAVFPFKSMRNTYVKCVGTQYREKEAIYYAATLAPSSLLLLVPEKSNPEDEEAIRVFTADGYHIGYISSKQCDIVRNYNKGITVGWMSTKYEHGKQSFSIALVSTKFLVSQLSEDDFVQF